MKTEASERQAGELKKKLKLLEKEHLIVKAENSELRGELESSNNEHRMTQSLVTTYEHKVKNSESCAY